MDENRFWSKVVKTEGCWWWTGAQFTTGHAQGYGAFHTHCFEPLKRAHRLAYCLANDIEYKAMHRIPIQQTCGNKLCCNPAHLKVTNYSTLKKERKNNAKESTYRFAACHA